jgi:hypothetical protein
MIASAVPDPSRDMQHNDSAHATSVLVASRAESAGTYPNLPIPCRRLAISSDFAAFRARRVRGRGNFHSILFE